MGHYFTRPLDEFDQTNIKNCKMFTRFVVDATSRSRVCGLWGAVGGGVGAGGRGHAGGGGGCEYLSSAGGPGRAARPRNCCPPPLHKAQNIGQRVRPRSVPASPTLSLLPTSYAVREHRRYCRLRSDLLEPN